MRLRWGGSALPPGTVLLAIPAPPAWGTLPACLAVCSPPLWPPLGCTPLLSPGPPSPAPLPCPFAFESSLPEEQHPLSQPPRAGTGGQTGSCLVLVCGPWAPPSSTHTPALAPVCPTAGKFVALAPRSYHCRFASRGLSLAACHSPAPSALAEAEQHACTQWGSSSGMAVPPTRAGAAAQECVHPGVHKRTEEQRHPCTSTHAEPPRFMCARGCTQMYPQGHAGHTKAFVHVQLHAEQRVRTRAAASICCIHLHACCRCTPGRAGSG